MKTALRFNLAKPAVNALASQQGVQFNGKVKTENTVRRWDYAILNDEQKEREQIEDVRHFLNNFFFLF